MENGGARSALDSGIDESLRALGLWHAEAPPEGHVALYGFASFSPWTLTVEPRCKLDEALLHHLQHAMLVCDP